MLRSAGVAAAVLGWVAVRVAGEAAPDHVWSTYAPAVAALAAATLVLPERVRRGARIGALAVAGITAAVLAALALLTASYTVEGGRPAWNCTVSPRLRRSS